jgi:hypothetical protein
MSLRTYGSRTAACIQVTTYINSNPRPQLQADQERQYWSILPCIAIHHSCMQTD